MDRDRLVQEIAHRFAARKEDAAAVYLFGSLARGDGRADSDVDVAVLYGKPVEPCLAGLKLALAGDIEERLGRPGSIWWCSTISRRISSIAFCATAC